jgi:hypothetical protein
MRNRTETEENSNPQASSNHEGTDANTLVVGKYYVICLNNSQSIVIYRLSLSTTTKQL